MRRARRIPVRYQLNKRAAEVVRGGHPWIFRGQLSTAATVFESGQWLRLVDGDNRLIGHGIFEADGAIGIRVLTRGGEAPGVAVLGKRIDAALARRRELRGETTGFRAIHGESDGLPAVVVDVYGDTVIAQSYSAGADGLARWAAARVARAVGASVIVEKPAQRRRGEARPSRVLRGRAGELVWFDEGPLRLAARPVAGQKSGMFLDLRGLRRYLREGQRAGTRVLNLFSYTGGNALAAEHAGAAEVWNVDASQAALDFGAAHHVRDAARHRWIAADVFAWLAATADNAGDREQFSTVIVDPPSMTSRADQVPGVLATYRKLYRAARRFVASGGELIACCCTSRVSRRAFRDTVREALGDRFVLERELPAEPDHPVGFAEADYLKVQVWRRTQ